MSRLALNSDRARMSWSLRAGLVRLRLLAGELRQLFGCPLRVSRTVATEA
jgi:hypothetical protein